jgi:hypothetical protein
VKLGDLVVFRNCAQQGMFGIISLVPKKNHLARSIPGLALYWVLCEGEVLCFVGNQLVLQ